MAENLRRLDDPSNTTDTLLTLPLSDFPNNNNTRTATAANHERSGNETRDDDDLILVSLPPAKDGGGLTVDDLVCGGSVYILGDTSARDVREDESVPEEENGGGVGGSIEPVAARLIVEGDKTSSSGKTLELTRVETSNTYIVVPPMPREGEGTDGRGNGSHKRQKLDGPAGGATELVTMPARSVGLVPGEDSPSCFFLDPAHLAPGHFASKLRATLGRWTYDPFDPPPAESLDTFGYTVPELAHVCRTSRSEIQRAIHVRVSGAEDALAMPSSSTSSTATRYGTLSEEGRQTVSMAIVSTLLESDLELVWEFSDGPPAGKVEGMQLSPLVDEIRSHWQRLEGGEDSSHRAQPPRVANPYLTDSKQGTQSESQSEFGTASQFPAISTESAPLPLADEVVWHCLRPVLYYEDMSEKDVMPGRARLHPDEVAKLSAHHAFLRGTPKSSSASSQTLGAGSAVWWDEGELTEAWSMRLPSMSSKYEPRTELLRGIAISEINAADAEAQDAGIVRRWQYFPEAGLPSVPSSRIKSMFAVRGAWTLEEATPYLERFVEGGLKGSDSMAADLLGRHAKAIRSTERDADGKDVSMTKYVATI